MARKDRIGNRKTREQRVIRRVHEMGYYLIVTDTEATERCFFTGLYNSLPEKTKKKLVIRVVETKTQNLLLKCLEMTAYEAQYRIPWIVFDRDQVPNFDQIIAEAEKADIHVGWSNPCFEIWMFAYLGNMPAIQESWICCAQFAALYKARTGQDYSKSDTDIYRRLCLAGDESRALQIAAQKYGQCLRAGNLLPSEMCPATTVHNLVGEIRRKVNG